MNRNALWLTASLMLPLFVGCTGKTGVIRGQSPADGPAAYAQPGRPGQPGQAVSYGPVYFDGSPSSQPFVASPGMQFCPHGLPHDHCQACGRSNSLWRPQHHHVYDYDVPRRLVYPEQHQMPAMVQYPYYTVKGPTDFFMK